MNRRLIHTTNKAQRKSAAPARAVQYVLPLGNGWVVKNSLKAKFTVITDTKKEAIEIARTMARHQRTELIVHAKDGSIQLKESYAA